MARDRRMLPPCVKGRIAVVGVCASGKSLLVDSLIEAGYDARSCAQEHSHVPEMWRRLSRPQVLIYLDASIETMRRRRRTDYDAEYVAQQRQRLRHARMHCDVYIQTDDLSPDQVVRRARHALLERGLEPENRKPD